MSVSMVEGGFKCITGLSPLPVNHVGIGALYRGTPSIPHLSVAFKCCIWLDSPSYVLSMPATYHHQWEVGLWVDDAIVMTGNMVYPMEEKNGSQEVGR